MTNGGLRPAVFLLLDAGCWITAIHRTEIPQIAQIDADSIVNRTAGVLEADPIAIGIAIDRCLDTGWEEHLNQRIAHSMSP